MHPRKTELARQALQAHRAPLDLRQRRALILCDGHRDLAELTRLLGPDAAALISQLQHDGYLHYDEAAPGSTPASSNIAGPTRRRSLVAARIYLLDILALQRDPLATLLHQQLQQTREESETLAALQHALSHLPALTSAGYAQRVEQRLREVLPENHLQALQAATEVAGR